MARKLEMELATCGKTVQVHVSEKKIKGYLRITADIAASDLVVVVGGDGTIRKLLDVLNKTGTPIYAIPGGNESLFARSYEMSTNTDDLLQAIAERVCLQQFYGLISGKEIKGEKPFFHMASMGLDSLTVKSIGKRKGPLNDLIYVWHGLKAYVILPCLCALMGNQSLIMNPGMSSWLIVRRMPEIYNWSLRLIHQRVSSSLVFCREHVFSMN